MQNVLNYIEYSGYGRINSCLFDTIEGSEKGGTNLINAIDNGMASVSTSGIIYSQMKKIGTFRWQLTPL